MGERDQLGLCFTFTECKKEKGAGLDDNYHDREGNLSHDADEDFAQEEEDDEEDFEQEDEDE